LHDEGHGFKVTISKGYWMGEMPVTVGAYRRFAMATRRSMPEEPQHFGVFNEGWKDAQQPMVNVTWADADAYCAWAGRRLPSEAEWERAARGGSNEPRYGELDEIAWYGENKGEEDGPRHVGLKKPNAFGLYDILGNVREWTASWYGADYYETGPRLDPPGPATGKERIVRGGSWISNDGIYVRASVRYSQAPDEAQIDIGFRCVGN